MAKDEKKLGIIIQYINILLNISITVFFTPFLIRQLGDSEYGLYRIVQSFAGQLSIMTFGIGILVTRNIVRFDTLGQKKEKENFLAMSGFIAGVLFLLIILIGFILYLSIDSIFGKTLNSLELSKIKILYWILVVNVAFSVLNDFNTGIISGHERFIFRNGAIFFRSIIRVCIIYFLLLLHGDSIVIVSTDLFLTVLLFLVNSTFSFFALKERIKYHYFDKHELFVAITFSFAIFLQAIVNQVNQNLDGVILGSLTDTKTVTLYSIGLTIFNMFNSFTLVIGTVFTPQATRLVTRNASADELTDFVIAPGRIQFMLGCLIISTFVIFGREFIRYWVGSSYSSAYKIGLILMIPALIPLVQNVTNSILDAMMKRLTRSLILIAMALIHVAASILLVKKFGYIGAAYGTAISFIVGNLIFVNIYLSVVTPLQLRRMYKELVSKTWYVVAFCICCFYPFFSSPTRSLIEFAGKIIIYISTFTVMIYFFAMRKHEREVFLSPIKKLSRR